MLCRHQEDKTHNYFSFNFELNRFCFQANVQTPKYTKKFVLTSGMTALAWPPVKTFPFLLVINNIVNVFV